MAGPSFDDRDGWIWFDGKLVPWREAKVHVVLHGLHYGSCVFEGERAYSGHVFKLRQHSQRLLDSAKILGMETSLTGEEVDAACNETLKASGFTDAYLRPVMWRGSESMGVSPKGTKVHFAVAIWPWGAYFGDQRMKGIRLDMGHWRRPAPDTAPTRAKAAGLYMIATLNKSAAEEKGYDDAMMLDWRGQVAEATGANIFFVKDGAIHTPTPDCFLDGITRRTVMGIARARQIVVHERAIRPEELSGFTECFLTGTAAEVTAVREIGPVKYTPGGITQTLMTDYDALVRMSPDEVAKRSPS